MIAERMAELSRENAESAKASSSTASEADVEPWLRPGAVLADKYRVDAMLGRGGMSIVVAARQLELDRDVAIKFLRGGAARDAKAMRRFLREARAIARMASDHVVRVFDVGVEGRVPFIVMERLEGVDLGAELANGPLPYTTGVDYLLQACEAIAEAHSLGIVHRDLKPSNLFLSRGRGSRVRLKVLDFGISKWLGPVPEHETSLATADRALIGTPAYASPEQLTQPNQVDERTDVWSLGVVLYQCLTGRLPFDADSIPRICARILTSMPAAPPNREAAPAALWSVVERCLQREPDARYASIDQLARALEPLATEQGQELVAALSRSAATATRARRHPRLERDAPPATPREGASKSELLVATHTEFSRETKRPSVPAAAPARQAPARRLLWVLVVVVAATLASRAVFAPGNRANGPTLRASEAAPGLGRGAVSSTDTPTGELASVSAAPPNGPETAGHATPDDEARVPRARKPSGPKPPPGRQAPQPAATGLVAGAAADTAAPAALAQPTASSAAPPASGSTPPLPPLVDDFDASRLYRR
jgi:serine/threonine protein kinase